MQATAQETVPQTTGNKRRKRKRKAPGSAPGSSAAAQDESRLAVAQEAAAQGHDGQPVSDLRAEGASAPAAEAKPAPAPAAALQHISRLAAAQAASAQRLEKKRQKRKEYYKRRTSWQKAVLAAAKAGAQAAAGAFDMAAMALDAQTAQVQILKHSCMLPLVSFFFLIMCCVFGVIFLVLCQLPTCLFLPETA